MYIHYKRKDVIMNSNKKNEQKEDILTMSTIVQKWGNSLAVRIPSVVAERVKIEQGSEIEMKVVGNERTITITPRKTRKKYSLEELVSKITPENRHEYIDFGREGRELI